MVFFFLQLKTTWLREEEGFLEESLLATEGV